MLGAAPSLGPSLPPCSSSLCPPWPHLSCPQPPLPSSPQPCTSLWGPGGAAGAHPSPLSLQVRSCANEKRVSMSGMAAGVLSPPCVPSPRTLHNPRMVTLGPRSSQCPAGHPRAAAPRGLGPMKAVLSGAVWPDPDPARDLGVMGHPVWGRGVSPHVACAACRPCAFTACTAHATHWQCCVQHTLHTQPLCMHCMPYMCCGHRSCTQCTHCTHTLHALSMLQMPWAVHAAPVSTLHVLHTLHRGALPTLCSANTARAQCVL